MKKEVVIISIIIGLILISAIIVFASPSKKTYMSDAPIVYNSKNCTVTVKYNGEILSLSDKQIDKLMYLMEHSYTKTPPTTGARMMSDENIGMYIDIKYDSDVFIPSDSSQYKFNRIFFTYEDKFHNIITMHSTFDPLYASFCMPSVDLNKLERILKVKFVDD